MPDAIDLRRRAPRSLRVRARGAPVADVITVRYTEIGAAVEATLGADGRTLAVRARLTGFTGIDIAARVAPSGRARLAGGVRTFALTAGADGVYTGSLALDGAPPPDGVRLDIVDERGAVLGTTTWSPAPAPVATAASASPPQIGAYAPIWKLSRATDVQWSAPTLPNGASIGVGTVRGPAGWTFEGQVRASGSAGLVGFDAALRSDTTDGGKTADGAAWLGARVRALRLDKDVLELAPVLRVGVPISSSGSSARLEPSIAVGGVAGRFTWLCDVGARLRLAQDALTPPAQGFLLAGGTADVLTWLRVNAVVDAQLLGNGSGKPTALGGLGAGIEAGTSIYGGLALHVAPWTDPGLGPFTAQLTVGFRGAP